MDISKRNGLMLIIAEAIEEMEAELGHSISLDKRLSLNFVSSYGKNIS